MQSLTPDELAAIRARDTSDDETTHARTWLDRRALLAHIDALTAERDAAVASTREALAKLCDASVRERVEYRDGLRRKRDRATLPDDAAAFQTLAEYADSARYHLARLGDAIRRWTP